MQQSAAYEATFRASLRAQWDLDSVLEPSQELDFSRNFLPQSLARTDELASLSPEEALANAPETEAQCFRVPPIIQE